MLDSDSLLRLRDEPNEDELFMAQELSVLEERAAGEGETMEANNSIVPEVDAVERAENSRDAGSASPSLIDITTSPLFT